MKPGSLAQPLPAEVRPAVSLPEVARKLRRGASLFGPLLALLVVLGLFSLSPEVRPSLFNGGNCKLILIQTVIVAVGALGMTMIIISGGIDLSAGSMVALGSVIGASLLANGWPLAAVIGLTILSGGLVGLVNGTIIGVFRMMPFIVTLGMMGMARGAAKWLSGNQTILVPNSPINGLMARTAPNELLPLPAGVWLAIGLGVALSVVMRQTIFGRYTFAIGSNEIATHLCGINVPMQKVFIYALGGLFFGLAGLMQLSRLTLGDPTVAIGLELDIIAAVVIGGASLNGGSGSVFGSMIGALIMAVLRNGSNQMGWPNHIQEIIIGAVIVLAMGLDKLRQGGRG